MREAKSIVFLGMGQKIFVTLLFIAPLCKSQIGSLKSNWTIKSPFEQKVFIENNEGQFDDKIDSGKVLFSTTINGVSMFFTPTGVIYRYDEYLKITPKQREESERTNDEKDTPKPIIHFFSAKWVDANPITQVIPEDEVSFYYCYPNENKHTTIAHAFKRLLYKNLYPSIDVEFSFPENKKEIQYTLLIHQGADISKAQFLYETGNKITFNSNNYDKSKTLMIAPWTINPEFHYNAAYDLDWDLQGNVYAYGSNLPNQLIKLNSLGNIQWIFNAIFEGFDASDFYGGFTVNKNNGTSYIGQGWGAGSGKVLKVNTLGIQVDSTFYLPSAMEEIWRMEYDECNGTIILGGGGTAGTCQAEILDTNLSYIGPFDLLGTSYICHDVVLMTIDYTKGNCYFAISKNDLTDSNEIGNVIIKTPNTNLSSVDYIVPDGYAFREGWSNQYTVNQVANGMNGMVTTNDWLYLYDGSTLRRFDKNNGSSSLAKNISPSVYGRAGVIAVYWGGLDADKCANIYLGNESKIEIYDSTLTLINTIAAPNNIYDIRVASNNLLYACGDGFISSYSLTNPALNLNKISTSACSNCNGTALANLTGCGSSGASYLWNTGQTTQYITGLCPGTYTVTISLDCETKYIDTFNIVSTSNPALKIPTSRVINVSCYGGDNGSATAIASGGTSPYNYIWFPSNNTSQTIDNLSKGTYTVVTTDSKGCGALDTITIFQPQNPLTLNTTPNITINIGQDSTLIASASGGTPPYTYIWEGNSSGSSYIVSPLVNTTYSVLVTDSNGCTALQFIRVDVLCGNLFIPNAFSPNNSGHNNILYVRDDCIKDMDFIIFDRWGNKIFESNSLNHGWDGTNKGTPMNMGTYIYFLKATLQDGTSIEKNGNVTLVR